MCTFSEGYVPHCRFGVLQEDVWCDRINENNSAQFDEAGPNVPL